MTVVESGSVLESRISNNVIGGLIRETKVDWKRSLLSNHQVSFTFSVLHLHDEFWEVTERSLFAVAVILCGGS